MTSTTPKVSVIVPTYNRASLIGGCIDAILRQTMPDFELMIVSDGSIDETRAIVERYSDPRIFFLEKENNGQASARNFGIVNSQGEYISLCDDDDRFYSSHLSTLCDCLDRRRHVGLAYSDAVWTCRDSTETPEVKYSRDFDRKELENFNYITPLNVMFRRSCLEKTGLFNEDPDVKGLEDWEFFLRLSDHAPFLHVRKATAEYTVHENNSFQHGSGYDYNKAFLAVRSQRFQHILSRYGSSLFDHTDHMYPFHLVQCYLNNGRFEEGFNLAGKLYSLYKEYAHSNNRAPFTQLLILFSLCISSFAAGHEETAAIFLDDIHKCPAYAEIKPQFTHFVSQYAGKVPDRGLRDLLA